MKLNNDFFNGARGSLPILIGVMPFAMITGVGAVNVGFTFAETMGMSVIVFAGASQLVVFQLLRERFLSQFVANFSMRRMLAM